MLRPPEGTRHRTLGLIDMKLEFGVQPPQQHHHPIAGLDAAHIDVAGAGITRKAQAPRLQRLVHLVKQDVGQQRTQWPSLRRAQMAIDHHPTIHDSGIQIRPDQLDDSGIVDASLDLTIRMSW